MRSDLGAKEVTRDRYVGFCFVAFIIFVITSKAGGPTWINQLAVGFFGGTLFSYFIFCWRHNQPFFLLNYQSWEALHSMIFLVICFSLIAAALWGVAKGNVPIVVIGVLLAQALFQATYESWWDAQQKFELKGEIRAEIESRLNTKIDDLRRELSSGKTLDD